jgi:hypothetical protein
VNPREKLDPARVWTFAEDLLAADEAARIEKLSDDELHAEMRREGMDPARVPSADEMLARVEARAARRAAVGSRVPESRRVAPATPFSPPEESNARRVAQAVPLEPVRLEPAPPRPMPRALVWLLAAAFALGFVFIGVAEGPAIVAYFERPRITPDNERYVPPTPHELAEKLRDDAMGHCAVSSWASCKDKLDEAARLDPAGDSEPDVLRARAAIDEANRPRVRDAAVPDKPGR